MEIRELGQIDFADALSLQEQLVENISRGVQGELLLLLEHPHVYTIGRGGSRKNILDDSVDPVCINRGGDITYHGPGQLIGYPVLELGLRGRDLHRYLRFLEELLIMVAGEFRVEAFRIPGRTGVWTAKGKLASIGVGVRRWITMHGFALNVSTDLARFAAINPCGIEACPVTSLAELCAVAVPMEEVTAAVRESFASLLDKCCPFVDVATRAEQGRHPE